MAPKRPTLKTISQLSGFAVTTVSRALADGPEIGQTTKETVRRIADEIGYVRNRTGASLATGKTSIISLIMSANHDIVDDHTSRLIASIANNLQGTDYNMNIATYSCESERLAVVREVVRTGAADAVILSQIEAEDARVTYLLGKSFPFATYGRTVWTNQHASFDFDNAEFGAQAARALIGRGRKRLLAIAPPRQLHYCSQIIEGVQSQIENTGITLELLHGATSHDLGREVRKAVFERLVHEPSIDGIIAPSSSSAVNSIAALEKSGLVLREDIDLFAKEAAPQLAFIRPDIMSVYEDVAEAGRFLTKATIHAIEHPDDPPMQRVDLAQRSSPNADILSD